jgi:FkbM family methyltransferase
VLAGPGGRSVVDHATSMARKIWVHPENTDVRGRRLAGWLAWQAWQRVMGTPRVIHLHDGVRLVCHPHDQVTSMALYFGLYDSQEMRFLLAWLRPGDTFVDVGANVAPYSLLSTLVDGVTAIAFEPEAAARARAAENIALNEAQHRIRLVPAAVSDTDGSALLTVDRFAKNALVDDGYAGEVEAVDTVTLDAFVDREGIDEVSLLKIDVEGREPEVLRGAAAVIARHRPALIVECNDPAVIQRFAEANDYHRVGFSHRTGALTPAEWPATAGTNIILVADLDEARSRIDRAISARPASPKG